VLEGTVQEFLAVQCQNSFTGPKRTQARKDATHKLRNAYTQFKAEHYSFPVPQVSAVCWHIE
jgi:hypothetical protein